MNIELTEKMDAFLAEIAGSPLVWGESDCTMQAHNWVVHSTGVQPNTIQYSSEQEAHRLIEEKGGLENIWFEAMSPHFRQVAQANYGDVGIIGLTGGKKVGCIFVAGGAAVLRTHNGTQFLSPTQKYIHQIWGLGLCE